jgi:hypothetical protein
MRENVCACASVCTRYACAHTCDTHTHTHTHTRTQRQTDTHLTRAPRPACNTVTDPMQSITFAMTTARVFVPPWALGRTVLACEAAEACARPCARVRVRVCASVNKSLSLARARALSLSFSLYTYMYICIYIYIYIYVYIYPSRSRSRARFFSPAPSLLFSLSLSTARSERFHKRTGVHVCVHGMHTRVRSHTQI